MGIGRGARDALAAFGPAFFLVLLGARTAALDGWSAPQDTRVAAETVPPEAQGVFLTGRATARLFPDAGTVEVVLRYRILPDSGARDVPLTALTPGRTRLWAVRHRLLEGGIDSPGHGLAALDLAQVRPHYWEGVFRLPSALPPGDSLSVEITYSVMDAWGSDGRITVPLLAPRWVPANPDPTTFQASLDIPPGRTVTGSFPTSVLGRPPPGEGGRFDVALQGVPSVLVLWTTEGAVPFFTLERGLDLLVLVSLLLFGALGFRALVRGAR